MLKKSTSVFFYKGSVNVADTQPLRPPKSGDPNKLDKNCACIKTALFILSEQNYQHIYT